MSFYLILQRIMEDKGLSIPEVARICGLHDSTVRSAIDRKQKKVELSNAIKYSRGLGVSLEYLNGDTTEIAPASAEAIHIDSTMRKYAQLDDFGKRAVAAVTDVEYERCSKPKVVRAASARRVIPYSNIPASAGLGEWLDAESMDEIEIPDTPNFRNVDFAVPVSGDSMMPTYRDGDILLIHEQDAVNVGDIGLFAVNGDGYVKEMGDGELISHNRDYDNIPINESFKCFGKVIGKL